MAVLVLCVNGCGDVEEPTESVSSALSNAWTPWFSEESPNTRNCDPYNDESAVMGAGCSGSYCDNMRFYCGRIPAGFTEYNGGIVGTAPISEESPNNVRYCPDGSIVYGATATGSYSDNVAIQCRFMHFPPQGVTCRWTNWLSEEQGTQMFDADFNRPGGAVATAIMCSGSYCDSISFLACEPRCTSDADCGVYVCGPNHWCIVG